MLAHVFQSRVAHQRAGEQAGFAQDLEAVTDAEDESSAGSVLPSIQSKLNQILKQR